MILRPTWLCLLATLPLTAQSDTARQWSQPFPAHKIAGNLYYVGSSQLSSFLITTPEGHILINSSFEETVPVIRAGVEKLGFRFGDIKILLTSHAHGDHVEGSAMVQALTKARVMVMQGDDEVVASGNDGRWKPCKVDRVLRDGGEVKLGGAVLKAHHTPGHTKGATTWTMTAKEGGKDYRVVIHSSTNTNPGFVLVNNAKYPEIAADFERSFRKLRAMPCDIFLAPHGAQYGLEDKYARLGKGGGNPFIDPEGFREFQRKQEELFRTRLKEQQTAK